MVMGEPIGGLPVGTELPMATVMGEPIVVEGEPIMQIAEGVPIGGQAPVVGWLAGRALA